MVDIIVYIIAGIGAGVGTGLAGMSAAMVMSPMLITFCGYSAYEAVAISLASDVIASAVTAWSYGREGNIDLKNGVVMMASVLVFTMVGSWASSLLPDTTLSGGSYLMTIVTGINFLVKPVTRTTSRMSEISLSQRVIRSIIVGIPIGLICGFVGAGGGVMMLFMLTLALGYDLKSAVGTSTFIMTFTAFTGAASHIYINGMPNLWVLAVCAVTATVAARITAKFANKMDPVLQNKILGFGLLALGLVLCAVHFL